MKKPQDIDEILSVWWDGHNQCDDSCSDKYNQKEAKQSLYEALLEVIGEDEPHGKWCDLVYWNDESVMCSCDKEPTDNLRNHQRYRLKDLFGVDDES